MHEQERLSVHGWRSPKHGGYRAGCRGNLGQGAMRSSSGHPDFHNRPDARGSPGHCGQFRDTQSPSAWSCPQAGAVPLRGLPHTQLHACACMPAHQAFTIATQFARLRADRCPPAFGHAKAVAGKRPFHHGDRQVPFLPASQYAGLRVRHAGRIGPHGSAKFQERFARRVADIAGCHPVVGADQPGWGESAGVAPQRRHTAWIYRSGTRRLLRSEQSLESAQRRLCQVHLPCPARHRAIVRTAQRSPRAAWPGPGIRLREFVVDVAREWRRTCTSAAVPPCGTVTWWHGCQAVRIRRTIPYK